MYPAWPSVIAEHDPAATFVSDNRVHFSAGGAGVCPLSHLGVLRVEGEEAAAFLHNITSNEVKQLPVGGVQWNSLNSAKGRMLASFLVWRDEAGFGLILAEELSAEIAKKLAMYVLRAKVKVRDASAEFALLGIDGEGASKLLAQAGIALPTSPLRALSADALSVVALPQAERYILVVPGERLASVWTQLAAQIAPADTASWIRADILAGIPLITKATQEEFVAQMVNFELLGGVNFQKGCYPGQEIVARTQYLGKLKKRMYRAHVAEGQEPVVGQDLYAPAFGDQSCGKLVSLSPAPQGGYDLLVVLQMAAREAGEVSLGSGTGPRLSFAELPYVVD